jgi:hypothetical protein
LARRRIGNAAVDATTARRVYQSEVKIFRAERHLQLE